MKRFRYALDPLCVAACAAYAVGRWVVQPRAAPGFWHDQFTDCLLIPAALPLLLWVYRRLGLRADDRWPSSREVALAFAIWAVATEGIAPLLFSHATGDWRDILAYATGAVVAGVWWALAGRPGFDLLAPFYPALERLLAGGCLQRCRTAWIGELAGARRLLIAGVGHGPALATVLGQHPHLRVTCVDSSPRMLAVARRRARRAGLDMGRLEFVHASLPDWQPPAGQFDAIATHFFLDCFTPEQLTTIVATLARAATRDVRWILSDFTVPARGPARWRALAVHRLMYLFFRVVTRLPARRLTPPDPLLAAHGFRLLRRETREWGLLQADLWQRAA
ncbi:MAG TPA: class I SAM-dependent methyltransferase [Lacunisphaera sp.]|nr:class I SAM-dependent methyltransferase [Lacunisphaera sp.]